MTPSRSLLPGLLATVALGVACGKSAPPPAVPEVSIVEDKAPAAPPTPPLYERLGGHDGVTGIVESFVSNVNADKRVSRFFGKTTGARLEYFKAMLEAQICEITGGSCEYTGKSMKDAHTVYGMGDADFDAVVQDFGLALQEKQVPPDAQKELLDKLEAMHDDIVGRSRKKK